MSIIKLNPAKALCMIAAFYLILSGCGPVLSQRTLQDADLTITFSQILNQPDSQKGKTVVCGGRILEVKKQNEEIWIEVLQQPLDHRYRPENSDFSQGRFFIILKEGFSHPALYLQEQRITVAGEVTGKAVLPIREMLYNYPIITPQEVILIEAYPRYDRTHRLYYSAVK